MSEKIDENEKFWRSLSDTYPGAYALVRSISIKYTKIHKDIFPGSQLKEDETKTLKFELGKDSDGNPKLKADQDSMILLVAIAEAYLEFALKTMAPEKNMDDIEKDFARDNKICPNPECGAVNKIVDEVCYECGTALNT